MKQIAILLYLEAVAYLERVGKANRSDAKILALCWLDFWIEHDVKNTDKHLQVKKHLSKF